MTECPFCHTKDGYETTSINRHIRIVEWDHSVYDTIVEYISGGTRCLCSSCGKDVTKFVKKDGNDD